MLELRKGLISVKELGKGPPIVGWILPLSDHSGELRHGQLRLHPRLHEPVTNVHAQPL